MSQTKLTRRQLPFTPRFLPSPFFAPFGDLGDFTARAQQLFDEAFGKDFTTSLQEWTPAVNVAETKDEFTVTAELPGMTLENISVDFTEGMLTIRGEKVDERTEKENDKTYYMWERRFGTFQRTLPFPGGIDDKKIAAEFKDGVLTVHLPKTEAVKPKRQTIPITATK
ncbi:MAG TPA: Hsp20/alpha crystallin family protein [Gemmatimonadaceae bacterium]|nr:Hsp20/alpha crystallin family protein [Gemmatimonadaceae bacterium]